MIANRFAADHYDKYYNSPDDNLYLQVNNPSPRTGGSKRPRNPDSPRDFLANRVSFYMDDLIASSNDDVDNSALDLQRQHSFRKHHPRNLMTRERSFRVNEKKPVKLKRHASDISPSTRTQKLQRKRSSNGSKRQPNRRGSYGGTVERTDSRERALVRAGSYRSNGSGSGKLKRQDSNSLSGSKRSSTRRVSGFQHSESSFKLPHKELPPKERRRRIVVLMVVTTFLFLVACSVLAVVITLTHSSFHRNAYYFPETAEHMFPRINYSAIVRKENEELENAINREDLSLYNDTAIAAGSSPTPVGL